MAKPTEFLNLLLPKFGEYYNRWWEPINKNFTQVDLAVGEIQQEVLSARGTAGTLASRLDNALNPDGSQKPTPEVAGARSSKVYGTSGSSGDFDLGARIEQGDREVWEGRQGLEALKAALAWTGGGHISDSVVSAPANFLTFTGGVVSVNGSLANPVIASINGYRQALYSKKDIGLSGAAGTKYIYLEKLAAGDMFLSGSASATLGTFDVTGRLSKVSVSATNFITSGVRKGHLLELTLPAGSANLGQYIVAATNADDPTNLQTNELLIYGEFASAGSGLTWQISDLSAPRLGFTDTAHAKRFAPNADRIYIGRAVFDGANVTSVAEYAQNGQYAAFTQFTADTPVTINHNLGFIPKRVQIFASQASDFTQPLEMMGAADAQATTTLTNVQASSGTASATTSVSPGHAVQTQITDTSISIKNAVPGLFYRDFSGSAKTTGHLYVVVER
jgi:hypothetical protein